LTYERAAADGQADVRLLVSASRQEDEARSMNDEHPILEIRQSAWNTTSVRDQRLRIFGDRVEFVHPKVVSEA
jgi:hypothetical protein